jgi:hypothetical protein
MKIRPKSASLRASSGGTRNSERQQIQKFWLILSSTYEFLFLDAKSATQSRASAPKAPPQVEAFHKDDGRTGDESPDSATQASAMEKVVGRADYEPVRRGVLLRCSEFSVGLHRRYIGIEIEPKYCDVAKRRLEGATGTFSLAFSPACG